MKIRKPEGSKRKKLNNAGLSLVELLVAMSVLLIVSVSVYQGFVQSARLNAKSKLQHKATSLAQNALEALKAENAQDIIRQFSGAESFDLLPSQIKTASSIAGAMGDYLPAGADSYLMTYNDGSGEKRIERYYFYIDDAEMDGSKFDMLITLDGAPYLDYAGNTAYRGQAYNDLNKIEAPNMDANYDAIIANTPEYDRDGYAEVERIVGTEYQPGSAYREIVITMKTNGQTLGGDTKYQVTAQYNYYYIYPGSSVGTLLKSYEDTPYNNEANPTYQLRNIFLFFRPGYGHARDRIVINNPENLEKELYMIKQQDREDMGSLEVAEANYHAEVSLNETPELSRTDSFMKLHSNLQRNIGNEAPVAFTNVAYQYNGMVIYTETELTEKLGGGNLTHGRAEDHIFDVTIEVFESDHTAVSPLGSAAYGKAPDEIRGCFGGKVLTTITGSIQNK